MYKIRGNDVIFEEGERRVLGLGYNEFGFRCVEFVGFAGYLVEN